MAKKYYWEIEEEETDMENGEPTGNILTHKVELICSNLTGKALITINGVQFDISEKPFKLNGTQQMFKLGSMPAMLFFKKKAAPTITVDNREYEAKQQ